VEVHACDAEKQFRLPAEFAIEGHICWLRGTNLAVEALSRNRFNLNNFRRFSVNFPAPMLYKDSIRVNIRPKTTEKFNLCQYETENNRNVSNSSKNLCNFTLS
jgi:hypothetical protein